MRGIKSLWQHCIVVGALHYIVHVNTTLAKRIMGSEIAGSRPLTFFFWPLYHLMLQKRLSVTCFSERSRLQGNIQSIILNRHRGFEFGPGFGPDQDMPCFTHVHRGSYYYIQNDMSPDHVFLPLLINSSLSLEPCHAKYIPKLALPENSGSSFFIYFGMKPGRK